MKAASFLMWLFDVIIRDQVEKLGHCNQRMSEKINGMQEVMAELQGLRAL